MKNRSTSQFVFNYFWGNIICSVASLISFPIFVRVFSVSEYGVLALVFSTLTIMVVFSKMGIQNSIVRFYPEFNVGSKEKQSEFFSTYFFSTGAAGLMALMVFVAVIPLLTKNVLSLKDSLPFYAAALFIPAHGVFSAFGNFFRARQEPVLFNAVMILETYLPLIVGLSFIFLFGTKIAYFFLGGFLAKAVYLAYFGNRFHKDVVFSTQAVSKELMGKALLYGYPLMLLELSGNLLAYGDRFIIKYYMAASDVAIYSVGYNLAMYMANMFVTPINNALQVEYFEIWTRQGKEKTEEYLSRMCKAIMYFGVIFCVVMILNFKYVILFFASSKYIESVRIAPYVITSVMIYALYPIFGAGIFISRTTKNLFYCVMIALVVNFLANVVLIPRIGILGAAVATFLANSLAAILIYLMARKVIKIRIGLIQLLVSLVAGGLVYYLCQGFEFNNMIFNVVSKSIASVILYSAMIMFFDAEYKYYCQQIYNKIKTVF